MVKLAVGRHGKLDINNFNGLFWIRVFQSLYLLGYLTDDLFDVTPQLGFKDVNVSVLGQFWQVPQLDGKLVGFYHKLVMALGVFADVVSKKPLGDHQSEHDADVDAHDG